MVALIDSESSRVVGSGEVALWRAVLEQALNDACILRLNPGVNRFPTPASRERDRLRATAGEWLKAAGRDFSLVCDWADLPAEAVQTHAYERLATPAEQHSRSLRQVVWPALGKTARAASRPQPCQRTSAATPSSGSRSASLTLTEVLSDELGTVGYGSTVITISDLMNAVKGHETKMVDSPEDERIASRMQAGTDLRTKSKVGSMLSRLAVARIRSIRAAITGGPDRPAKAHAFILRSLKHQDEVTELRRIYENGFVAVAAYAPRSFREKAISQVISKTRPGLSDDRLRSIAYELIQKDEAEEGEDLGPESPRAVQPRPAAASPWKRPKDLPKGEIWPPDQGLHPIPESWKEEVRRGYPTPTRSVSGEVI